MREGTIREKKENGKVDTARTYLKRYREPLYLLFFLSQIGCVAWGLGSGDKLYKIVFAAGLPCLLLSMAGEYYSRKDIVFMAGMVILALCAFMRNGNRSLILACMAVYGTKNIDLRKVLSYTFWVFCVLMTIKIFLCVVGVLSNETVFIPKGNTWHTIYCFGFDTPNNLYFHLVVMVLLGMVLYGDEFRWTAVFLVVFVMYGAYRILMSRTGWICFLVLAALYILVFLLKRMKGVMLKYFMMAFVLSPAVLALLNWGFVYLYGKNIRMAEIVDGFMTGRLSLAWEAFAAYGISALGSKGAVQLDMLYSSMLLNYGIILSVICIGVCIKSMWRLYKKQKELLLIAMTVMAVYSFMEVNAINPMWNPFILYTMCSLFESESDVDDTCYVNNNLL